MFEQISRLRSDVLHPYKLVKDVRTNVESTDAEGVLGGDLEEFIKAIFNGLWFIKTNNFLIAF